MNRYVTELIGTFFLVFTIGCAVLLRGVGEIPPIAIGAALMVMVYAGGHISGAHYNPAVTLAVWMRGRCAARDVAPYWISQILGAALATRAVLFLAGSATLEPLHPAVGPALLAEFLFTFALCYVVLNTATAKGTAGNSFYGVAIGMTVMTGAFSVAAVSGAVFNPAVAIAISMMRISPWPNLWIYLVAELAAALAAAIVFKWANPEDR